MAEQNSIKFGTLRPIDREDNSLLSARNFRPITSFAKKLGPFEINKATTKPKIVC